MSNGLKKALIGGGIAVVAVISIITGYVELKLHPSSPLKEETLSETELQAKIERGHYIARASDCKACHTGRDQAPYAGGFTLHTPFGDIVTSNITSDPETGIGGWTIKQFDAVLRHGVGKYGFLYPAMPYNAYTKLTDEDVSDLWAYIRQIPAVRHKVQSNQLPFPYNQRILLAGWNYLFFTEGTFRPDLRKDAEWNRGAYLVEGPEHCATCHTAKNSLGGNVREAFGGTTLQNWHASDLTPNKYIGLGNLSDDQLFSYLKTGTNDLSVASGPMGEAVEESLQYLTDSDIRAIITYIRSVPATLYQPPAALPASDPVIQHGKTIFETQCSACHVSNGTGVPNIIPAFARNPIINAQDPASLIQSVLIGAMGPQTAGNPTGAGMPRFDWNMPDGDIAAVLNYIRNSWGNAAPPVTPQAVAAMRRDLKARSWIYQGKQ
ncbi:c-type cytochrome [Acetobacteraceae bacterium ESL0709]|nr:c-type cytochrome [Acetobacteraceae bacterium ESL0697]MDF7678764.1 c-type cytochrome [Acetobacteraceae bacterium ESL0709]